MSIGAIKALTKKFNFKKINFNFPRWHSYEHDNWDLLDAILRTYVSNGGVRGLWQNSTAYEQNQRVIDPDEDKIYLCLIGHTSPALPTTFANHRIANPLLWKAVSYSPINRGQWMTGTVYSEDDFVVDGTKYAIVIQDHVAGATFAGDVIAGKLHVLVDLPTTTVLDKSITLTKLADGAPNAFRINGADNRPIDISSTAALNLLGAIGSGQCLLIFLSATQIVLQRFDGYRLVIDSKYEIIPSAGIILTNAGLAANTTYFVYAYMNGATMALIASTTGHVTGPFGVQVSSTNALLTLVGMVRTNASAQFQNTNAFRGVLSYFNRRTIPFFGEQLVATTTQTSPTPMTGNGVINFLNWGDEGWEAKVSGYGVPQTAIGQLIAMVPGLDGAVATAVSCFAQTYSTNVNVPLSCAAAGAPSEGFHTSAPLVWVGSGQAAFGLQVTGTIRG